MMALGDILAARADNARARGTVEAGTLGTVTVEALPVRELERLMRGADGDRDERQSGGGLACGEHRWRRRGRGQSRGHGRFLRGIGRDSR